MSNKKVKTVPLKETFSKITKTAKVVNEKIVDTATEVVEDIVQNREAWMNEATKTAKTTMDDVTKSYKGRMEEMTKTAKDKMEDVSESATKVIGELKVGERIERARSVAKNINEFSKQAADDLVEVAFESGKEWQGVAAKAVKGGLKLADKQQDIMFDTLETLKGQMFKGVKRFRNLIAKN